MSHSVLTVILKGDDWTHRKKFNLYEEYTNDESDPVVAECIQKVKDSVKETATEVEVKTSKFVQ